jgi:hypothetical protein
MNFILLESWMNGTVTMSISPSIIIAKSFEEVKSKLQIRMADKNIKYTLNENTNMVFSYNIWHEHGFIYGKVENKMIEVIQ